jgi:carbonic anhydrase
MEVNIAGQTKVYNLLQCHFHWGSEHSLAGQQQVLELHCVHQLVSNSNVPRYGVLGIFFELGATNSFLARFEDALPTHTLALAGRRLLEPSSGADLFGNPAVHNKDREETRRLSASKNVSSWTGPIDFKQALTGLSLTNYWNYDGSFTTPPCTEAVDWYVLQSKATVSQTQLDKFKSAMGWQQAGGNFRSAQPLSGRTIYGCGVLPKAQTNYPWYPYSAQNWALDTSNANSVCQHGTFQSPINFASCAVPMSRRGAEITWAKQPVKLLNNGHAVQMTPANAGAGRGKMVVDRKSYTLLQCHWHWSSEHTVGEKQYPLEVHCVHQLDGTDEAPVYGVFGMFYELSASPNPFLSQFEDLLPRYNRRLGTRPADGFNLFGHAMEKASGRRMAGAAGTVSTFKGPLDFKELYNGVDLDHYWNYEGSFTTPPCTEAVTFYIMMDKAPITQAQLDKFKVAIGWEGAAGNFRPPQPLQGRTVSGCRSVATPVIAVNAPNVKTKKCVDQTAAIVLQAVIACVVVMLLAATLYGAWAGIFSPSDASARGAQGLGRQHGGIAGGR